MLEDDEECIGRHRVDSRNDCTLLCGLDGKGATWRMYITRAALLRPTMGAHRTDLGIVTVPPSGRQKQTLLFGFSAPKGVLYGDGSYKDATVWLADVYQASKGRTVYGIKGDRWETWWGKLNWVDVNIPMLLEMEAAYCGKTRGVLGIGEQWGKLTRLMSGDG